MKIYKNIYGKRINVHCKALAPDAIFKTDNIDQEIQKLVKQKYLLEVDQTKPKGTLK